MTFTCETCKQILDWMREGKTIAADNLLDEHLHDISLAGVDRSEHPGIREVR